MITIQIGAVQFHLRQDFDFSFLKAYGEPFTVFDRQDSGNLCFGMQKDQERLFIKMAGALTERMHVTQAEAIRRLISTAALYEDLRHPALIPLLEHKPIPGGYMQTFAWFDGTCMGKQYGRYEDYLSLPLEKKLMLYDHILDFHRHVAARGYVAIDFYDGCILYDFLTDEVRLCDIEMYHKGPLTNHMGRMWGSTRYMSPEEFIKGAVIDEVSNVYCMGAAAFNLMGGIMDHSFEKWTASRALFEVARKAVSERREDRYPSIDAYAGEWKRAGGPSIS